MTAGVCRLSWFYSGGRLPCLAPNLGLTVLTTLDPKRPARNSGYFGALTTLLAEGALAGEYG